MSLPVADAERFSIIEASLHTPGSARSWTRSGATTAYETFGVL